MEISDAYNEWSAQYDTNQNKTRDLEKIAAQALLRNIPYRNVIELGCGTGKNTQWLIEKAISLTGLDFSVGMLELAKTKIVSDKVTFIHADLTKPWPVGGGVADLVVCSLVLEHIESLDHIFSEAFNKLSPGGYFYLSELHPFKQYSGTKARFERGEATIELKVFVHHVSDYIQAAIGCNFQVVELKEWFDRDDERELPRLISFVFQRKG